MTCVKKINEMLDDIKNVSDVEQRKIILKEHLNKLEEEKKRIKEEQNTIRYDEVDACCVVCNATLVKKMIPRFDIEIDIHDNDRFVYKGYFDKCIMCPKCGILYEELPKEVIYE